MGDFVMFSEDIDNGMLFLEHHGILNQRWGHRNGPPYPLDAGDHSAIEKAGAKKAGIRIGKSSGAGSMEAVEAKKKTPKPRTPKKEMTPEERREAAMEAARSGDKKKIAKYINELSTEELREAQARAQMKDQLTRQDPNDQKASKADIEKLEAMRSGDKEKVKEYADKMSYAELAEAMNKVNLMEKLNSVEPPPSAMDKLSNFANKVDQFRVAAEKGVAMYNLAAKVYNSTNKDGGKWPIIGGDQNQKKEQSQEEKVMQMLAKQMHNDVKNGINETQKKSHKEEVDEAVKNAKTDYKAKKKFEKWEKKQEEKAAKKEAKKNENTPVPDETNMRSKTNNPANQETSSPAPAPSPQPQSNSSPSSSQAPQPSSSNDHAYTRREWKGEHYQYYYSPEDTPKPKSVKWNNFNKTEQQSSANTEPTQKQKELLEQARKSDQQYLDQMKAIKTTTTKKMSSYDDVSYDDIFTDAQKESMRQSYKKAVKLAEEEDFYQDVYEYMYDSY